MYSGTAERARMVGLRAAYNARTNERHTSSDGDATLQTYRASFPRKHHHKGFSVYCLYYIPRNDVDNCPIIAASSWAGQPAPRKWGARKATRKHRTECAFTESDLSGGVRHIVLHVESRYGTYQEEERSIGVRIFILVCAEDRSLVRRISLVIQQTAEMSVNEAASASTGQETTTAESGTENSNFRILHTVRVPYHWL